MKHNWKKEIAVMLGLSLLISAGTYLKLTPAYADPPVFINVNPSSFDPTLSDFDQPWAIDCGTLSDQFVYMTIENQGLVAKIDKTTRQVLNIFNDPDDSVRAGGGNNQNFYSIARDPNNGALFINERNNGKVWRFDPSAPSESAWTRIPIIEQVNDPVPNPNAPNPYVEYNNHGLSDLGFVVEPNHVLLHTTIGDIETDIFTFGDGTVVFAKDFVWVGLAYTKDWLDEGVPPEDGLQNLDFKGLARIDPINPTVPGGVTRIPIPGALGVTALAVDTSDQNILWITDNPGNQVFMFNMTSQSVVGIPIPIPDDAFGPAAPRGITTDSGNVYVALNKAFATLGQHSQIARISKSTLMVEEIIDLGPLVPVTVEGTFSVMFSNGLIVWTDNSNHIGTLDTATGEVSVETTSTTAGNHYGCVALEDEFWWAGQGSAHVGIWSKFSGGRPVRATGGSNPVGRSTISPFAERDEQPPVFGQVLTSSGSLTISAQVSDNVAVVDVTAIIGKKTYAFHEHNGNPLWWDVTIPSQDLPSGEVFFKLIATDVGHNKAEYQGSTESAGSTGGGPGGPLSVIAPLTQGIHNSAYSIVGSGMTQDTKTMNLQVTIKNTSNEPLQNIRIMLSPELKGKFLLSDYAIKSIDPNSEHTISLKLNGKPNVDVTGEPIPYNGRIIISVDNKSPYILELSGAIPNESASLQSLFMKMITSKAEERYKSFVKPEERISESGYNVKLGSGENVIRSASDELIITNTSDKPLKNLRIMTSAVADHFIPEQKNIELLPAGSFIKVKLVSKMNDAVTRDLQGEVIIAPENGLPVSVPVSIGKQVVQDKNLMYKVSTISGSDSISSTADAIVISNNSEESLDNVRIILPQQLSRVFSLSEDSFRSIEPNSGETVYIRQRGTLESSVRQILNDYTADIVIVSSDGMKKVIPVSIVWKGIPSEHFVVYARDNAEELAKAAQVINFLERSYAETTSIIGETDTKTVIYMTSSLDELRMLSNALAPSTYVYDEDIGFVWSNSEDLNILALKEFTYRTIMQNYGTYWVKQKISADKGNWLIDGISTYVTASIVGERGMIKNNLDAFIAEPASFEWYGAPTQSQYAASYTLFKFLAEKYGESIIDSTLRELGSTMVSNSRCDTIEQCALLNAVYDANGWSINDKKHELDFATIIEEWNNYVEEKYYIKALN